MQYMIFVNIPMAFALFFELLAATERIRVGVTIMLLRFIIHKIDDIQLRYTSSLCLILRKM